MGGEGAGLDPRSELSQTLDDLETLLKNGDVVASLTARGINASLALLAAGALRAYLGGRKAEAADDFATAAEEIQGRLKGRGGVDPGGGNGGR